MPVRRPSVLAVPLVAGVLLLAGCTGDGRDAASSSSPSSSSASPAPSGTGGPGATAAPTGGDDDVAGLTERLSAAMAAKGTVTMTIDDASQGREFTAEARMRYHGAGTAPDLAMDLTNAGESISMVILPGEVYLSSAGMGLGDKWVRLSEDGSDVLSRSFRPLLEEMANAGSLDTLLDGSDGRVTARGTQTLDGATVSVYELASQGEKALLYVDADGLPRRVESTGATKSVITYTGWGEPLDVSAPPADEVVDAADLLRATG